METNTTKSFEEMKSNSEETNQTLVNQDTTILNQKKKNELVKAMNEWIKNRRLNLRSKVALKRVNFGMYVPFIPVALGFSHFLIEKSNSSPNFLKKDFFFEKNLPVFAQFNPKLKLETFEYISKSNRRALGGKITPASLMFGQVNFGAMIKNPNVLKYKKFNGLSVNYLLTSGNFLSSTKSSSSILSLARKLDELPAYLQSLKQFSEENKNQVTDSGETNPSESLTSQKLPFLEDLLFSQNYKLKQGKNNFVKSVNKNNSSSTQIQSKKISIPINSTVSSKLMLVTGQNEKFYQKDHQEVDYIKDLGQFQLNHNPFFQERFEFFNEQNELNNEFQTLFSEKHLSYFSNDVVPEEDNLEPKLFESIKEFPKLTRFLKENSEFDEDFLCNLILHELENTSLAEEIPYFRFMSGYKFPDMTSQEVSLLYQNSGWNKHQVENFVLENSSSFVSNARDFLYQIKKSPKLFVETTEVNLQNPESKKIISQNRVVLFDSQQALDWKLKDPLNIRSWYFQYLSPLNPLKNSLNKFYGLPLLPKSTQTRSEVLNGKDRSLAPWKYFPIDGYWYKALRQPVTDFPSQLFCLNFIPEVSEEQMHSFQNFQVDLENKKDTSEMLVTVPVLQFNPPTEITHRHKKLANSNYSSYFTFNFRPNCDYEFYPEYSATGNKFLSQYSSGFYHRKPSLFVNISKNIDNWETFTHSWWLVITQYSFAVFLFTLGKQIVDTYGRELLGYFLDLISSFGFLDESVKEQFELLLGNREKGFHIILESEKTFQDIVGIQKIVPELYEVILFLRNKGRKTAISKTLPRGILLTGPPGTGKTLLVQAIAGEAQVPVIVLSGSSLIQPGEPASLKLEMVFEEARYYAPCIVFIDEIETLAQKRNGVVQNPMGSDELIESLTSYKRSFAGSRFEEFDEKTQKGSYEPEDTPEKDFGEEDRERLNLLTQFLIELDGIHGRENIIVFGATNRPEVMDPAVLRPGRFDKILQVGLPNHQKRVEILQFYGDKRGYGKNIPKASLPWNYLGNRTAGYTAADLATIMNESLIKAGVDNIGHHTVETIEHGIDRLTTSENLKFTVFKTIPQFEEEKGNHEKVTKDTKLVKKPKISYLTISSKMTLLRLAYYQAGKIVVSSFLKTHPKSVVASLWPRRLTSRSAQTVTNLQNSIFEFAPLCEITDRLIGCYAGKAAEVLFIQQFSASKYAELSTLGHEDLIFAQKLVYRILDNWLLFSKKSHIQQKIHLAPNINVREFRTMTEKLDFYLDYVEAIQNPLLNERVERQTKNTIPGLTNLNPQEYYAIPWWEKQICFDVEAVEKNFNNWSRFYLSNPEQNKLNPEWVPPDEFYHISSGLKNIKKAFYNLHKPKTDFEGCEKSLEDLETSKTQLESAESKPKTDFETSETIAQSGESLETDSQSRETPEIASESEETSKGYLESEKTSEGSLESEDTSEGSLESEETSEESSESEETSETTQEPTESKPKKRSVKGKVKERTLPEKAYFPWNDVGLLTRDYPGHSLILQSFNKALVILNQNRELLDKLVVELLTKEILREPEIEAFLHKFYEKSKVKPDFLDTSISTPKEVSLDPFEKKGKIEFVEESWGHRSRKPLPRWIDFADFSEETT